MIPANLTVREVDDYCNGLRQSVLNITQSLALFERMARVIEQERQKVAALEAALVYYKGRLAVHEPKPPTFDEFLKQASIDVATWPAWKRDCLQAAVKSTNDQPRPVISDDMMRCV